MSKKKKPSDVVTVRVGAKRVKSTIEDFCEKRGVPENVMLWRMERGITGSGLYQRPNRLYTYNGKVYTPLMLAEKYGIAKETIITRWEEGKRGYDLVRRTGSTDEDRQLAQRESQVAECREHLRALFYAHPERREHAWRMVIRKDLEPFDEATARRNAQRFEAEGHEVRTQGMELVA